MSFGPLLRLDATLLRLLRLYRRNRDLLRKSELLILHGAGTLR